MSPPGPCLELTPCFCHFSLGTMDHSFHLVLLSFFYYKMRLMLFYLLCWVVLEIK